MLAAIWRKTKAAWKSFSEDTALAIDYGDIRHIIRNVLLLLLALVFIGGSIALITLIIMLNIEFIFYWIIAPIVALIFIIHLFSECLKEEKEDEIKDIPVIDDVETELIRQRAMEIYPELQVLLFSALQSVAQITPLLRPHDPAEIETSTARAKHFYIDGKNVIFQFEGTLESSIDRVTEDMIQRELQRSIAKYISRYPLLIHSESQGRVPLEVLDVKNCGSYVLIEVCQTTEASIPMIDARRRARIERQQKQQRFLDEDYR